MDRLPHLDEREIEIVLGSVTLNGTLSLPQDATATWLTPFAPQTSPPSSSTFSHRRRR